MPRQRLGEMLVHEGRLDREQLDRALAIQRGQRTGEPLGQVLISLGLVSEDDILEAVARQHGTPYARLGRGLFDPRVVGLLPKRLVERHAILPLFKVRETLTLAMADPSNIFVIDEVERATGLKVQPVLAPPASIADAMKSAALRQDAFEIDDIVHDISEDDVQVVQSRLEDLAEVETLSRLSPVVRLVNLIVYRAIKEGASDIHIEANEGELRVRFRVDGVLHEALKPPAPMHAAIVSRLKVMANLDIAERRQPQEGRIKVVLEGRAIDLRLSVVPAYHGEKAVIRVLDGGATLLDLGSLGFARDTVAGFRELLGRPHGIVLVTGPTGSGKTTTLYSALCEVNSPGVNISTVENPVEYDLKNVTQLQTNEQVGFTFAKALRALLRQDPDVIMVGEIRDPETADVAIQAALTGHLVLSTLHTNDAPGAITRLINMGIKPYLLSAAVAGVLAQRLVRRTCGHCREECEPAEATRKLFAVEGLEAGDRLRQGRGCERCRQTGFHGRIGIYELLVVDDPLRDLVVSSPSLTVLRGLARDSGMKTLRHDGLLKVREGITSLQEVLRVTAE